MWRVLFVLAGAVSLTGCDDCGKKSPPVTEGPAPGPGAPQAEAPSPRGARVDGRG